MNKTLVWQLAARYMLGKRSANAVPVLSRISMIAIAVSSCALIILFSIFNGFENLVDHLYQSFYPDIRVTPARGKFFAPDSSLLKQVNNIQGIAACTRVLEDNVFVQSEEEQLPVTLKGIEAAYFSINHVKPYITQGRDTISTYPVPTAIVGEHIAATLGIDVDNVFSRLLVYYPNGAVSNPALDPAAAFQSLSLRPDGTFRIQEEFDSRYVLADLALVQRLMKQEGKVSSIEISLAKGSNEDRVKAKLQQLMGASFKVETRYEQNKSVYLVMRSEKWAGFAILLFVLLIASFNMVGALSLLVLEKQRDIGILKTMGAQPSDIQRVILLEGVLWSLTGGLIGLGLGLMLCFCQYYFHWIKIQGDFIIEAYPVAVQPGDILIVIVTVTAVGLLAAIYPARQAARVQLSRIMARK